MNITNIARPNPFPKIIPKPSVPGLNAAAHMQNVSRKVTAPDLPADILSTIRQIISDTIGRNERKVIGVILLSKNSERPLPFGGLSVYGLFQHFFHCSLIYLDTRQYMFEISVFIGSVHIPARRAESHSRYPKLSSKYIGIAYGHIV